jgi:hypothetical protein
MEMSSSKADMMTDGGIRAYASAMATVSSS